MDETLDETLGFYVLTEAEAQRRPRPTNFLKHEHAEIRCRTRVIRIVPNEASYLRHATALAAERNTSGRRAATSSPPPPP